MNSSIHVVGAGPTGSLFSLYALKQLSLESCKVFEKRSDPRRQKHASGRSINLAMSERGLHALRLVGLEQLVFDHGVPVRSRTIHPVENPGKTYSMPYSHKPDQFNYAISRKLINDLLLDQLEQTGKAELYFNSPLKEVRWRDRQAVFGANNDNDKVENFNVMVGTDGIGSTVRREMYKQTAAKEDRRDPLDHVYMEFVLPAGEGGKPLIDFETLHIWPRKQFMLMALPNNDGSFTLTLFMPEDQMQKLKEDGSESVREFFKEYFGDIEVLLEDLEDQFQNHPVGKLDTLHCYPWANDSAFILGDAAHAIVPFYGQGLNCSFEDVSLFFQFLQGQKDNAKDSDLIKDFSKFQIQRKKDTDAIAELALQNYVEMRDLTADEVFLKKKALEKLLIEQFPQSYNSLYNMVTYQRIPYSQALRLGREQDKFLERLLNVSL